MDNHFILTPFFFDRYDEGLADLSEDHWVINRPDLPSGNEIHRTMAGHRPLVDLTMRAIKNGERPVSIAGDCCAAIPVMAGLQQAGIHPVFLWVDAHGDFNTWDTTLSGFLGGMPLAMMVGLGERTLGDHVGLEKIPEKHIVLTDGRDLDPGERQLIEASEVVHLPDIMDLLNFNPPKGELYIHFDTDILDPSDAPAMGYLASGGPPPETLEQIFHHLANTYDLVALSMSTWRPSMDTDGRSQAVCMRLLNALIGQ